MIEISMVHVNILQNITYDTLSFSPCYIEPQLCSYLHRIPRQKFEHYFRFNVTCGSAYSLSSEQTISRKGKLLYDIGRISVASPHESHTVEDDACAIAPSIHSFS